MGIADTKPNDKREAEYGKKRKTQKTYGRRVRTLRSIAVKKIGVDLRFFYALSALKVRLFSLHFVILP